MLTKKFNEGETYNIKGLDIHIPPVGYVYNRETDTLEYRGVFARSSIKKDQYWERQGYIDGYDKLLKAEKKRQETDPEYEDPTLAEFRNSCWDKRINGMWFYNNGTPTYITGMHWFYLEWIHINNTQNKGYPFFWTSDKEFFWFLQYVIDDPDALGMIYVTKRREGKALDIETEIPTPNGFKKLKDIEVGDTVFDKDGKETKVTFVTETMYNHKCYKVSFDDGASVIADAEHRWLVRDKQSRNNTAKRYGEWSVETTESMMEKGIRVRNGKENNFHIPFPKAVEYKDIDLPIDPWILGCWLGDGNSDGSAITSVDEEIIERCGSLYEHTSTDAKGITRYYSKNEVTGVPFRTELRHLDLLKNKHIPDAYMTASYDQRMELIRGLFDTDGYVDYRGRIEFCNKNKELVYQVSEILNSLGLKHRISCDPSYLYDTYCGKRYRLKMTTSLPVFSLDRKKNRQIKKKRNYNWAWIRAVVGIEQVESRPVKCIEVNSQSHTFLCTRDYIVTHNTAKSVAFALEAATRIPNLHAGIQSKTEEDAKKVVYMRGVVHAFSKLPEFFKPVYDMSGGSRPRSGLRFVHTPVKGKKAEEGLAPELGGSITFKASSETAYDGEKLGRYVGDEIFKTLNDVEERHRVVRFCLTDYDGNWDGKALYTSTCEEIEGYIDQYIQFWDKSDQENKGPTGKTKNGLYRYFLSSDEAMDRDKYGNCNVEKNRAKIIAEREFVRSDKAEYNSVVRKQPLTIEEAFRTSGTTSMFDTVALADRIEVLQWKQDEIYDIGNFYWKDGDNDGDVEWRSERNGRFKVRWDRCGKFTPNAMDGRFPTTKVPGNQIKFVGGCDPYDSRFTSDGRGSDGAFVLFRKYDINDVENSHSPCVTYSNRPPTPQMFYEDILMCCVFFGAQVLVENNKLGIIKYIDEYRHMSYYMMKLKGRKEYGIPAHDQSKELMSNLLVQYYYENLNKVDFVDLLRDSMNFDPTNTRKSDLTMAFGWALVGDKKLSVEQQKAKEERMRSVDIKEIFGKRRRRK